MTARIWIDVEDLFQFAAAGHRPSGIQRLVFELCRALVALHESKDRVFFVRHDEQQQRLTEVTWEAVELLFEEMSSSSNLPANDNRDMPLNEASAPQITIRDMLPSDLRKFLSHQKQAMAVLVRFVLTPARALARSLLHRWRSRTRAPTVAQDPIAIPEFAARPGDILAVFGAPWISSDYHSYDRNAVCEKGLRFAVLIHDIIPLRRHDWFDDGIIKSFQAWFEDAIQLADVILANSAATAADISAYACKAGLALRTAPTPIPIGTGFTTRRKGASVRSTRLPPPDTYVLIVSTIEIRKNHALLVRVWQLLLDNMPPESVPTLVFALGEPWAWQSRNCWDFACHVQRELFGRELPRVAVPADPSKRWILQSIERHAERGAWREVPDGPGGLIAAADGALVLMAHLRFPAHIGVWLKPEARVIHCSEQHGVCCESVLALRQMGWKQLAFYEPIVGRP